MEEEKKTMSGKMTDRQITALGLKVAKAVEKKAAFKDDVAKVLEIAKALLSLRIKD